MSSPWHKTSIIPGFVQKYDMDELTSVLQSRLFGIKDP